MASIAWLPWSAESFAKARNEAKPVLLSIAPSWCEHSQRMDRTSYSDAGICSLVNSRFVAIRVDADRRPDVSERYGLGGFPTTAFLTADGLIVGGGTFVDASRLAEVLQRVCDAIASGRHLRARPIVASALKSDPASLDRLSAEVFERFDPINGGFGSSPKFPHVAAIRLALTLFKETGSPRHYEIAVKSLDAMGWGPLYDNERGGFFSYSSAADWSAPNEAKRLDVNAALLSLYVDAFETLQLARYGERAEDVLRYTQTWLADPIDGGWGGSQRADHDYYAHHVTYSSPPDTAPPVDRTLYCGWNGMMVSAVLQAARVFGDTALSEFAIKSLERVLLLSYQPGAGVAHYIEEGVAHVRGLLDDQMAMAVANLDAFEVTGNVVYDMMAEEIASYAVRTMWDEQAEGFFDRAVDPRRDVGLLKEPVKPFVMNCVAADALRRLGTASRSSDFADYAARTLTGLSHRAPAEGVLAAEYVLAEKRASER